MGLEMEHTVLKALVWLRSIILHGTWGSTGADFTLVNGATEIRAVAPWDVMSGPGPAHLASLIYVNSGPIL